jgi:hypothetical protein
MEVIYGILASFAAAAVVVAIDAWVELRKHKK